MRAVPQLALALDTRGVAVLPRPAHKSALRRRSPVCHIERNPRLWEGPGPLPTFSSFGVSTLVDIPPLERQLADVQVMLDHAEDHAAALRGRRDELIRELSERYTVRALAALCGLSPAMVGKIMSRRPRT